MRPDVATYFARRSDVPGWFFEEDFRLFDWLLEGQGHGDLLEIGTFQGSSAILLGLHRRTDETFTVCDLFGQPEAADNRAESEPWYGDLTRASFESNFTTFAHELPVIVEASSLAILDHVGPETCRFVHIDGCHLYDYVRADIEAARTILNQEGILACDDWRTLHTPGVTVAVLEQMAEGLLHPIAITEAKFYGSWNPAVAAKLRTATAEWVATTPGIGVDVQSIRGVELPRVYVPRAPAPPPSYTQRALGKARRGFRKAAVRLSR